MPIRVLPSLLLLLPLVACAGLQAKDPAMRAWSADAKRSIAQATPEQEAELQESLEWYRSRLDEGAAKHIAQAQKSNEVVLGRAGWNAQTKASTFESQIDLLRRHDFVPVLKPYAERQRGRFYEPPSKKAQDGLAKLYKHKQLLDDLRVAYSTVEAVGLYVAAEQEGTVRLNWSAELHTLQAAAEVVGFQQQFAVQASDETLEALTKVMGVRDQTRQLMATHTAMLAAFEGVAAGGDPAAVGRLAAASQQQGAAPPPVAVEDARTLVADLGGQALDIAASLEITMRAARGDEEYERHYRGELVETLRQIEEAEAKASLASMVDQQMKQARLLELQQMAQTVQQRLTDRAKALGLEKAEQVLERLPFGSQIVSGLRALRELRNGNPRGALMAAIDAAPPGPWQEGLRSASKIAFDIADKAKKAGVRRRS